MARYPDAQAADTGAKRASTRGSRSIDARGVVRISAADDVLYQRAVRYRARERSYLIEGRREGDQAVS
jgi:hypothetical protein